MLIYSRLHLKSCDCPHKQHNFAANKQKYVFGAIKGKEHNSETKKGKCYFLWGKAQIKRVMWHSDVGKETVGLILTVRMKNKIFPKAFFSWEQDQNDEVRLN